MDEIKLCVSCKFANPLEATVCVRCGAPLVPLLTARLTPVVPGFSSPVTEQNHEQFERLVTSETVVFVLAGSDTPLSVRKANTIMLGREIPNENASQINLNPYNAFFLGVSRQHAAIELSGPDYFIRDLESTNGTWLNGQKLIPHDAYPVHNGDLIRLGQMGLYIYFRVPEIAPNDCIITDTFSTITLTPEYLTTKIGTYLVLLSEINSIIDTMMEHTQFIVTIQSIALETDANHIRLRAVFNDRLLYFLENNLIQWKRQHNSEIRKIWELEQMPLSLDLGLREDPFEPGYKQVRDQIQFPLTQLVKKFIADVSPSLTEADSGIYFDKLMPLMYQLVRSSLQMRQQTPSNVPTEASSP